LLFIKYVFLFLCTQHVLSSNDTDDHSAYCINVEAIVIEGINNRLDEAEKWFYKMYRDIEPLEWYFRIRNRSKVFLTDKDEFITNKYIEMLINGDYPIEIPTEITQPCYLHEEDEETLEI